MGLAWYPGGMVVPKKNIVAGRMREARLRQKLSQDQLSAKLARQKVAIDRAGVSKIETGIRCVYDFELKAIARVLRTTPAELLGD
jgi:transcriptional regulator with XRE-family HTH domain